MRGNETHAVRLLGGKGAVLFPIPMRGNEHQDLTARHRWLLAVSDPHEG